jgi:tetratricopeptide (TPR) repeat protein
MAGLPVTEHFVRRDEEMRQLEKFFPPDANRKRRKVFVVHGLGGMGKTQLCVEYVRRHKEEFTAVFWLDGSSKDALRQSLASAAARVVREVPSSAGQPASNNHDVDGSIAALLQWLSSEANTGWLLVLDNIDREWQVASGRADPQAYDFKDYLPPADQGNVLITTRLGRLQRSNASLRLGEVGDGVGREMLESRAGRELPGMYDDGCIWPLCCHANLLTCVEYIDAGPLLDKLGGLPLALVQAGAYIGATNLTVGKYITHYDKTWDKLMSYQDRYPLQEYAERSVLTTWKMSYEQVRAVKPEAARLLDQWAFLHPGEISYGLVERHTRSLRGSEKAREFEFIATDELSFQDSVGVLAQYSLVNNNEGAGNFSIHAVVHDWSLYNIVDDQARERLCVRAIRIVVGSIPLTKGAGDLRAARKLLRHVQMAATRHVKMREVANLQPELHRVARFLEDWESSQTVESLYVRVLRGAEEALGTKHILTLSTANDLGSLYTKRGKLQKAEEMYLRALKGFEETQGAKHMSTLDIVNNLGNLYISQGKMQEAEMMYVRALGVKERSYGTKHTSTLDTVNNLGTLYADQGRLQEAEGMLVRALSGREIALGRKHRLTLDTVNNLGLLYADQGKMKEAEEMLLRALRGYEEAWGAKHTSTLGIIHNIGNLYSDQGKLKEAEEMYMRALRGFEEALGAKHTSTLDTVNDLGNLYADQSKVQEAEEMYLRALRGYQEARGAKHTTTLGIANNLGNLYRDQG